MSRAYLSAVAFGLITVPAPPAGAQADFGHALENAGVGDRQRACKPDRGNAVVVCGRRSERFRIDRKVLETARAANAQPPRASLMDQMLIAQRYGEHPEHGRVIPNKLIGVPTGKGGGGPELAAKGETVREALRHGEDDYAEYRSAIEEASAPR